MEWIKINNRIKRQGTAKTRVPIKQIFILTCLAAAIVSVIKISNMDVIRSVQVLQTGLVQETPTPAPSFMIMITVAPTEFLQETAGFEKKKAAGVLVLINWEYPLASEERPEGLVSMGSVFDDDLVIVNKNASISAMAGNAASEMFKAAKEERNIKYLITSAYRSISYQETLYQYKLKQDPDYGNDPYKNPVKVLPGKCSEHTTGLAVDILSEKYQEANEGYADTKEGKWLQENAHKYGFILRYPEKKEHMTGVIYEPWHYRYVGVEAAKEMYEKGLCLEEYVYVK